MRNVFLILCLVAHSSLALEITGEWRQGAILIGRAAPNEQIEFLGRKVPIAPDGQFVLGLGRDAASPAVLTSFLNGHSETHEFIVKMREYPVQHVNGVPQQTVEPSVQQVERSKHEAQLVADARKANLPLLFFAQPFKWPLLGTVTGVYGSQRVYNGVPKAPHYGVDIAKPVGTLVYAPAGGLVTLAHPDMFFSGGTLIVDHGYGLSSTFIHLSKILVKQGYSVIQGQKIALVGQTGRASGPHLHWAMNWFDTRVDPLSIVEQQDTAK